MSKTTNLIVDPGSVSVAAAIREAAQVSPCLVLTGRALRDLSLELGGLESAMRFLDRAAG